MNELNKYYKSLCGDKDSDITMVLLSSLPHLSMMEKLFKRKQDGKKKFSLEFQYDKKIDEISKVKEKILSDLKTKDYQLDSYISMFQSLAKISSLAREEVKMNSLKNDFDYLSQSFLDNIEVLNIIK